MNKKPWLDGPTAKDRARDKIWQGSIVLLIGAIGTLGTYLALGIVWMVTVIAVVCGLFWLLTGLVTYYTGVE